METRHQPRQLHTFDLITADNFEHRLPEVEKALRLKKDALVTALLPPDNLHRLKDELKTSFSAIFDTLDRHIINVTDYDVETPEVAAAIDKENRALKAELNQLYDYMKNLEAKLITSQMKEIEHTRQIIMQADGCYAGNHAHTLNILKRNIAIALQNAAHAIFINHEASKKVPTNFNKIFSSISHINQHEEISHSPLTESTYADFELNELQRMLSQILADCNHLKEQAIMHEIKTQLKALNHMPGNELIQGKILLEMHNDSFQFTNHTHNLEDQSIHAALTAKKALLELDKKEDSKIEAYEEDEVIGKRKQKLHAEIARAEKQIDLRRQEAARKQDIDYTASEPVTTIEPPKPGFWQRHPIFKKVCIGALIGLGIVAVAAIVIGSIILAGGVAATALTTFAGAIVSKFGIAGTIGFGVLATLPIFAISAASGGLAGDIEEHQKELKLNQTTTAGLMNTLKSTKPTTSNTASSIQRSTASLDIEQHQSSVENNTQQQNSNHQPITLGLRK